jgi:LysM repeat protein
MRFPGRTPGARSLVSGLPLALAGSIALALTPEPAHVQPAHAQPSALPSGAHPQWRPATAGTARPAPVRAVVPASARLALSAPVDYVVQAGDTVSAIAARHGLRTADVLSANGLGWSSIIYPGQVLRLGSAPAAPAPPAPAAPVQAAPAAAAHTVRSGDTVTAIAQAHGVSVQAVLDANGLTRGSIIYPGQTLAIPAVLSATPAVASTPAPSAAGLDAEQTANAQLIIRVGRELGVSDRGIAIALGTAMVESWLRNLDWGDRDSLGLFQQRPSTGWGTAPQILDPVRATRAFFGGPGDPNGHLTRGLLDIAGWESMSFADAAQAVQVSAFPDRYAQWEQSAHAWVAALG